MIYRNEYFYKKINSSQAINNESDFLKLLNEDTSPAAIDTLTNAFSDLRLAIGRSFKLDHICFLFGNGCSIYAGSNSTTEFNITNALEKKKEEVKVLYSFIEKIKEKTIEEQLNALLTACDYYRIIGEAKLAQLTDAVIKTIKTSFLTGYVNSVNYRELSLHEIMLMKLRAFGGLNRVSFYTLNYDLTLEYMLDKLNIEYADGFLGFVNRKFDPGSLQQAKSTRLVKLHGSINWKFDVEDKIIKEMQPSFIDGKVTVPNIEHVLIYPTAQKLYQTYNAPYSELMRNMLDAFCSHRNVIFVLGYRYSDEHINDILFKAIANPDNIFYFFDYEGGSCAFIQKMMEISESTPNIHLLLGKALGDFKTFVKYMLPANPEKTDEEKVIELLNKVMDKHVGGNHAN